LCIKTKQPGTKSGHNANPNATIKQHAAVSIQLDNSCMSYLSREIHSDSVVVVARFLQCPVVVVTRPQISCGVCVWQNEDSAVGGVAIG